MNTIHNPAWSRIATVMEYARKITGLPMPVDAFAHQIGLFPAEKLYKIKRGETAINAELALKINASFPMFNIMWLIGATGEPKAFDLAPNITGTWENTGVNILDLKTGLWDRHQYKQGFSVWQFNEDDTATIYENGQQVDVVQFAFDHISGRLNLGKDTFPIIKLTEDEMEYAEWSEDISRFIFKRTE